MESIFDRSSYIFSAKSKKNKELEDVRKKVEDAWTAKAAVLYDDEFDFTFKPNNKKSTQKFSTERTEDGDLVEIGNEISRFLNSDRSIFDVENVDQKEASNSKLPCFDSTNSLPLKEDN